MAEAAPLAPPTIGVGEAPGSPAAPPVASPTAPVAPSAAPATPPVETPAPAPAAAPAPAPAPIEPAAAAPPAPEPTLLQKHDAEQAAKEAAAKEAAKKPVAADGKPAPSGEKPAAAAPEPKDGKPDAAPAAPEPVAYEYALPETIKMDDALKGKFHSALDGFRADPAKGAQALVDMHNEQMQAYANELDARQRRVFAETRGGWVKDVMADPELGGAGYQTTMGAIARVRDVLVPEKERAAFNQFLEITGAGDHPSFLRMLHRAARYFDEAPLPPPGARPPPDLGKPQGRGLRGMYKSNQQGRQ